MKSRIGCRRARSDFPAVRCSAFALRARSPIGRRFCSWTSRVRRSIPIATAKVEDLIHELKHQFTIVIVTHNMQQATRCSDRTAFFYLGKLIEYDDTQKIFTNPGEKTNRRLHHRPIRLIFAAKR